MMALIFILVILAVVSFINLLVFLSEIRSFRARLKKDGIETAFALLELEEAWERNSKKGAAIVFYPGLKLARWWNRRSFGKKLKSVEERKVYLRKLREKLA